MTSRDLHTCLGTILLVLVVTAMSLPASAQTSTGSLRGVVQDSAGARLPKAQIVAREKGSAFERRAISDDRGEFRLIGLLPGDYQLTVSAPGFADASTDVELIVSSVRDYTITLRPAGAKETVQVESQPASISTQPIDLSSAVHQTIVTSQDLTTLPLASRSFANIAYLAPGTEPVEPSDPTKARITAVSTGGSSGLNNNIAVDGVENSDDWIGGFLQNFSPEALNEFAVQTAQEDADIGGTTAGSFVLTTKRGTDDWHGSFSFYDRAADLNARYPIENPAPNPKQPFSRQNYIGTIGGPLKKDKVWMFASFEHVHENASIAYSPASTTQFDALSQLAADGLIPGVTSIAVPPNAPIPFRDYLGSVRFDFSQSPKSQWFLRTSADSYLTRNNLVQQGTLPSTGLTTHNNYWNIALGNTYNFNPNWLGTFTFGYSELHLTQDRNSDLGFALAFPFSATSLTVSGFETFGDNQFATPITFFPNLRNQEKYQFRYDVSHTMGRHAFKFGIDFIHEPVLSGSFPGNDETLFTFPQDPSFYITQPGSVFTADMQAGASTSNLGGSFAQNVQRLAFYGQDSWRVTPHLTLNYGLRYQTTFGLFEASGRSQLENPAYLTLKALNIPLVNGAPHDYRRQFGPRLGIAYSPGNSGATVIRAGFGIYWDDLAQGGWASAFQAVNVPPGPCAALGDSGCIPGSALGGAGNLIDSRYRTPYNIHATAGVQHAFNHNWTLSADYTHEQGNNGYRGYTFAGGVDITTPLFPANDIVDQQNSVPDINLFKSDNRSNYNALMIKVQGNMTKRFNLVAHYTLSRANTWGCFLGELFDYVNCVCDPLNPFGPGDYGPSGEDVTHRFVLAGTVHIPGGFEVSTLTQAESARPFTLTTPVGTRAVINGVESKMDEFRGTPYVQVDLRVSRPIHFADRFTLTPFAEFFNLFNRNNPGANYVTDISALPNPVNDLANATAICSNPPSCTTFVPITSSKQLLVPSGGLGDFFGPGTTVGIPFAAQLGFRFDF